MHYFGSWDDPVGALNEWLEHQDNIVAKGRRKDNSEAYDIDWLVNAFLDSKDQQRSQGELSEAAFRDYRQTCERIAAFFGKGRLLDSLDSADFARFRASFPDTWGPTSINNQITRVSVVINFAFNTGAVDSPIRTGPNFKRVSKKKQRLDRAAQPKKIFTAEEIHRLVEVADVQLKAMILLGINAGYGNADVGRLEIPMIDFKRNWLEGLRHKTAIERAAWLWPETVAAIKVAIENRYPNAPNSLADRIFITKRRQAWHCDERRRSPLSSAFGKLTKKAGCDRERVGFYALRHVFETIAGNTKDQIAVNYVMGHADESMAEVYREGIDPKRIKAVCQHVRKWFLDGDPKKKVKKKRSTKRVPKTSDNKRSVK